MPSQSKHALFELCNPLPCVGQEVIGFKDNPLALRSLPLQSSMRGCPDTLSNKRRKAPVGQQVKNPAKKGTQRLLGVPKERDGSSNINWHEVTMLAAEDSDARFCREPWRLACT
eukprot:4955441-Amphidinium_carterae.1